MESQKTPMTLKLRDTAFLPTFRIKRVVQEHDGGEVIYETVKDHYNIGWARLYIDFSEMKVMYIGRHPWLNYNIPLTFKAAV